MKTVSVTFTRNVDNICRFLWIQKKVGQFKIIAHFNLLSCWSDTQKKDFFKQVFLSQKGFEYV